MPNFKNKNNELYWLNEGDDHKKWLSADCVQITDKEAIKIRTEKMPMLTYKQKRDAEYPPMADYLDGIVKGDTAQVNAYIAACLAVKAKYPKP